MLLKKLFALFLIVFASTSFVWTQTTQEISTESSNVITERERAIMEQVSRNRVVSGYEPVKVSKALSKVADIYNMVQALNGEIGHGHLPARAKTQILSFYAERYNEHSLFKWTNAWAELNASSTSHQMINNVKVQSHIYDHSNDHTVYLYNDKYDYIGWSEVTVAGKLWVTTYLIDAKDEYD